MKLEIASHTVRQLGPEDAALVQAIFDTDPSYFERVELAPLRPDEGRQIFDERPPLVPLEHKYVFVVDDVCVLDFLEGYPEPHIWFLGLIFLVPTARGRGLGTRFLEALCAAVRDAGGTALRLAVMDVNPEARRLYERLGFRYVTTKTRTSWNGAQSPVAVLERAL